MPGNSVCLGMAAFTLEQFLARLGLVGPARTRPQPGAGPPSRSADEPAQPIA